MLLLFIIALIFQLPVYLDHKTYWVRESWTNLAKLLIKSFFGYVSENFNTWNEY